MLDQSFSVENFKKIYDYENRKGNSLEKTFFKEVFEVTREIKMCTAVLKKKDFSEQPEQLILLNHLKERKESLLIEAFKTIRTNILNPSFKIELSRILHEPSDKHIYVPKKSPEIFFAVKHLQDNLFNAFKVKQADRFAIMTQVKTLLSDGFPKYVVKTDIKSCYESIPHERLLKKLDQNNALTHLAKKMIRQLLSTYCLASKEPTQKGIPRGVGVSAYLAELYLRDIDNEIKAMPNVTYYARYVDDIIVVFTPSSIGQHYDYQEAIQKIIENTKYQLQMNLPKTKTYNLVSTCKGELEFLGYKITFNNTNIKFKLSKTKIEKIKDKVNKTFEFYEKSNQEKQERKWLIKRIRYLTGNTRLQNSKKNVLVGIYFSNSLLTDDIDIKCLDGHLKYRISKLQPLARLKLTDDTIQKIKNRLSKYNFTAGFNKKLFSPFTERDLETIVKLWKSII